MKKKLLFVMPGLAAGGGEKSLVNLLNQIDYGQYEVDLFLFNSSGLFIEFLPKEVRILPTSKNYVLFSLPYSKACLGFLLSGKIKLAFYRTMFSIMNRKQKNVSLREQYGWKYLAASLEPIHQQYDAIIGFLEKSSTYFCIDKAEGNKKIGWVHIDYDKLGMDPEFDLPYFNRLDAIVTVSEECANILKQRFPSQSDKIKVIYNIISPGTIRSMAKNETDIYRRSEDETVLLSIGRLHHQKGFELAIEACKLIRDQGYKVKWYIIGEGEERKMLEQQIKNCDLEPHMKLLGLQSNPYPYIEQADIYVQPSRFEGKSIAVDEAKILHKPIIVTNFSTAQDQIVHEWNGLVVNMDSRAIAEGIKRMIEDPVLRINLSKALEQEPLGTENEVTKLYQLI